MKARLSTVLILFSFGVILAFNNCTKSSLSGGAETQASKLGEDLDMCKIQAKVAQDSVEPSSSKVVEDLRDVRLRESTELLVLLDSACARDRGGATWLSHEALEQTEAIHSGKTIAIDVYLDRDIEGRDLVKAAEADECVLRVDREVPMAVMALPNDPYYSSKQTYMASIGHDKIVGNLYNSFNGINQTIRVAVLDTGVDVNHADLQGLFLRDGSGQYIALNAIDNNNDVLDSGFHGTHVTGLIAGVANNGIGISGVMGKNVNILPVRVSSDGESVDMTAVVNGIRWAADNGAKVINMSLGGPTDRPALKEAIQYAVDKGVFVVAAAGNNGMVLGSQISIYPAMYASEIKGMVAVGSYDVGTGATSSFSNRSPAYVDIMAPGSNGSTGIVSTIPANLSPSGYGTAYTKGGKTYPIQGTSMASPIVAGSAAAAIALAKSRGYDAIPSQIEELLDVGSTPKSAFTAHAKKGNALDLNKLFNFIGSDTGVALSSTTSRASVKGKVTIQSQPQNVTVPAGQPLNLTVEKGASSSVLVNYQWYKNNVAIAGANKPVFSVAAATATNAGTYRVEIKAGSTLMKTSDAVVTIGGALPTPSPTPGSSGTGTPTPTPNPNHTSSCD